MINNNRKGISQILFLIIAAAILMMVAMTLVFMFQDSAGNTDDAQIQGCTTSIDTMCDTVGGTENQLPRQCMQGTEPYSSIQSRSGVSQDNNDDWEVDCTSW